MKLHSVFSSIAMISLLTQSCGNHESSKKMRSFDLPDGSRLIVQPMISLGEEGEQVTEYDSANNQIRVSWCPAQTYDEMVSLFRKSKNAVVSGSQQAVAM